MEHPVDAAALADEVCGALADAVQLSTARPFTIALSGGSTPKRLYEAMAQSPLFDWAELALYFGDERAVPPDHPDSNYRMVKAALLDQVKVRAHRMPADTGDAEAYAKLLPPAFDLVLLGLGGDGHTASLFPGSPELDEQQRKVVMTAQPHLGHARMTITLPVINAARRVWVLAAGADKAAIVAQVKDKEGPLPIQRVKPVQGELRWWLDRAAASS